MGAEQSDGGYIEEVRFRGMGSDVRVLAVDAPTDAVAATRPRLDALERKWSRFLVDSELTALNRSGGGASIVSEETAAVIALAVDAWHATRGLFDPTLLDALMACGYDCSFELVERDGVAPAPTAPRRGASVYECGDIVADAESGLVMLPAGLTLDLGGIGKGRAADLLVEELLDAGAAGACANVGGDIRAEGCSPEGGDWWITVEDELDPEKSLAALSVAGGGVATSTTRRRRWRRGGEPMHHLLDPDTGRPLATPVASVTVLAATAAWAEVLTKVVFVAGPDDGLPLCERLGGHAIVVTDGGDVLLSAGMAARS
jgi:thiamine biosynthesis lipoprotein